MACEAGLRWLDVGCGTGALSAAVVDHSMPVRAAGIEPAWGFLKTAQENLKGRVLLSQGSAGAIPLADSSVDVVVSGLVLNFVPDPRAALAEMARVTHSGGRIGAYLWDYAGKMEMLRLFWDAATALNPGAAKLDEGKRFPLCHPQALTELFAQAGLREIEAAAVDIETPFASFDDYWQPFLGGQGPAPSYVMALDNAARAQLRDQLEKRIQAWVQPDGSILMTARAWAVHAIV